MRRLLDNYPAWLKDKTILRQVGVQWVEITTPYLDRHNDGMQLYAKVLNGSYLLTDDGSTIQDVTQSGCILDSPKRQALLKMTLNGFGIKLNPGAVEVHASATAWAWLDTREVRPSDARADAVLNDLKHLVPASILDALRNYEVQPVEWSKREMVMQELAG